MEEPELERQSFVVTIWLEDGEGGVGVPTWRGRVTHVPSGERRYLSRLEDIADFVRPYLLRMGVNLSPPRCWPWRMRRKP